ncbi:MAG: DUF3298 domain-containing protein [Terracidiphilus sp.]
MRLLKMMSATGDRSIFMTRRRYHLAIASTEGSVLSRIAICIFLATIVAHAASFNCAKAKTPQERAICASPKLSVADGAMAAEYKEILRIVPPETAMEIRQSQLVWIRKMATHCPENAYLENCLLSEEQSRTDALKHMIYKDDGVTFVWHHVYRKTSGDDPEALDNNGPGSAGSLEASWPSAISDAPEWAAWNMGIETATHKIVEQSNVDTTGPAPKEWKAVDGSDVDVSVSVDYVGTQLVTSTITNFWDGHGAHPSTDTMQFNWMLKEQRRIRTEDIFREGSEWNTKLYTLCDAYLHKTLDPDLGKDYTAFSAPGTIAERVHAIASDPENWQIDEKGITLVFQAYAVACYACTPPPLIIPWTELQPLLRHDFQIPRKR